MRATEDKEPHPLSGNGMAVKSEKDKCLLRPAPCTPAYCVLCSVDELGKILDRIFYRCETRSLPPSRSELSQTKRQCMPSLPTWSDLCLSIRTIPALSFLSFSLLDLEASTSCPPSRTLEGGIDTIHGVKTPECRSVWVQRATDLIIRRGSKFMRGAME